MTADFSEWTRLGDDLGSRTPQKLRRAAGLIVRKSVLDTLRDAQATVAVDTGNLKNSGSADFAGSNGPIATGEAGFSAEYADYVERGTSRMAPQPYLTPAFDRQQVPFAAAVASLGGEIL